MSAVALVGEHRVRAAPGPAHRRQHARQLVEQVGVPAALDARILGRDVGVERVDPDAEGHVALELRRRSGQHEAASLLGAPVELGEQVRLADPRLALDRQAGERLAIREGGQRALDQVQLGLPPDGLLMHDRHLTSEPTPTP